MFLFSHNAVKNKTKDDKNPPLPQSWAFEAGWLLQGHSEWQLHTSACGLGGTGSLACRWAREVSLSGDPKQVTTVSGPSSPSVAFARRKE